MVGWSTGGCTVEGLCTGSWLPSSFWLFCHTKCLSHGCCLDSWSPPCTGDTVVAGRSLTAWLKCQSKHANLPRSSDVPTVSFQRLKPSQVLLFSAGWICSGYLARRKKDAPVWHCGEANDYAWYGVMPEPWFERKKIFPCHPESPHASLSGLRGASSPSLQEAMALCSLGGRQDLATADANFLRLQGITFSHTKIPIGSFILKPPPSAAEKLIWEKWLDDIARKYGSMVSILFLTIVAVEVILDITLL